MEISNAVIRDAICSLRHGKRLPSAIYVFDDGGESLPFLLRNACAELRRRFQIGLEFNIVKFHTDLPKVSFLSYPRFFEDAHPSLEAAVIIDLVLGRVRRDDYSCRANPPILHRKETFLPDSHPSRTLFSSLTKAEEDVGLLAESTKIGFKLNWNRLLNKLGIEIEGHRLKQRMPHAIETSVGTISASLTVQRHRTALVRAEISKPVKTILAHNQLRSGESFFDYGCGLGGDIRGLTAMGYTATGWDPVHAANSIQCEADVVNLGFVLNVIEDPAERVDVLASAWGLARRLLVVSTLVRGQEGYSDFKCFGDGVLTARNTFQKHFEPAEIQALIEDTLASDAVPVALGIYFIFRRVDDLQDFLSSRTKRFIDWESLSYGLGLRGLLRRKADPYDTNRELLDSFWQTAISLGRVPRTDEYDRLNEVRIACGSVPKAMALFLERFGQATFDAARARRREDTLVYIAASRLRKRIPFAKLSRPLQGDLLSFFGSYPEAEKQALDVMYAAGDIDELVMAVQNLGFGWWDATEQHFTVHRSLIDELPVILRVYVECAARLFGSPDEADLIKFHLRSRKLTFQLYDNFDGAPFPELKLRIKIDLPRLFVTVLDQRHARERQLLYFKDRFVGPNHSGVGEMRKLSLRLKSLGFDPATIGYGPTRAEFEALLASRGLTWRLTRKPKKVVSPSAPVSAPQYDPNPHRV
ncbi:MAG: DNA phosphorothioation-associated putative methyltransferase [Nibricoccus sp.]